MRPRRKSRDALKTVLCLNPRGKGDLHELRARRLCAHLEADVTHYNVDRSLPARVAAQEVWKLLRSRKWDLVYQEGTGLVGGANLIRAARVSRQRYIVSSGDPIGGFFRVTRGPAYGLALGFYERLLYRYCAGFVGWTPYLTGMALQLGARRAVTVEGAVDRKVFRPFSRPERLAAKQRYGLHPDHVVCGVVGSLKWTPRQAYCYGLELVEALKRVRRADLSLLIVGDGDGRSRLEAAVPEALRARVVFTGRLPEAEVVSAMNAMDVGFITQTLDGLGSFRLTTKLPEYLACGLPVAMSPTPGYFDYVRPAGWPLPPLHPASPEFHAGCAAWLDGLCWDDINEKAGRAPAVAAQRFDYDVVGAKFRDFVHALLDGAADGRQPEGP